MKKYIICYFIMGVLFFASCMHKSHRMTEQGLHQTASKTILTGWLTQEQIFDQNKNYKLGKVQYQPDEGSIKKLKSMTTDVQVIIFLGTWCPDSEREVPRFLKVMELSQNSQITYKLFGLDRTKRDPDGLAEKHQVEFVPTFIVVHKNEEIGRIVETPIVGLEQDLVEILASVM